MRQIFTSQRLETVEGVAKLLKEAGIAVHVSNARSYRGQRGSQFRYTEPLPKAQQPAVWIRHPEDQPRARQILREAGLLETTRPGGGPTLTFSTPQDDAPKKTSWAWRIRILLLVVIAVAVFVMFTRHRPTRPPAAPPVPASAPTTPVPAEPAQDEADSTRVRVQPATPAKPN